MTLLMLLILATAQDVRFERISNRLIVTGIAAGFGFQLAENPAWGVYYFLRNVSVPVILLYLLFQMRVLGAGDIKLLSMTGSLLTFGELLRSMTYSFLSAGVFAALYLASDSGRWQKIKCAVRFFADALRTGRLRPYVSPYPQEQAPFAFAVPVLFGTAIVLSGL